MEYALDQWARGEQQRNGKNLQYRHFAAEDRALHRGRSRLNEEAIEMAKRLAKEEGILSGISCGATAAVAVRLAHNPECAGKTIAAILPDSGERYQTTVLYEGMSEE